MGDLETDVIDAVVAQIETLEPSARERVLYYLLAKFELIAGFDMEDDNTIEAEAKPT